MWNRLPADKKSEYKRLILAQASLTEMSAQKADVGTTPAPIISSKYQETVFARAFNATPEDIGNTSFDASIELKGTNEKFLIGIKTFGYGADPQKIAQFKSKATDWALYTDKIKKNAVGLSTKDEITTANIDLYKELAVRISELRNDRIDSSIANLKGFKTDASDRVESVYHVLMPACEDGQPVIFVGETSYDKIDISNIRVIGCSSVKAPANFNFTDGHHIYHYTVADSQLLMNFENKNIVIEQWNVIYADDAYRIYSDIADRIYGKRPEEQQTPDEPKPATEAIIEESHSWMLINDFGTVERYSGYNSFYGTRSKRGYKNDMERIRHIPMRFADSIGADVIDNITGKITAYFNAPSRNDADRFRLEQQRDAIMDIAGRTGSPEFIDYIAKTVYRSVNEIYIPIPDSHTFHTCHPKFFTPKGIHFGSDGKTLADDKEQTQFNLVFEPSGDSLPCYITQDNGKAIQSCEKQSYLGQWILRGIFQLAPYQPLTAKRLDDIGINAVRLYKLKGSDDIHLQFIWIDPNQPPKDMMERARKTRH